MLCNISALSKSSSKGIWGYLDYNIDDDYCKTVCIDYESDPQPRFWIIEFVVG